MSGWHCGSAVVYREPTKTAWLGISPEDLRQHNVVSEEIARQMALGVLRRTPEAHLSAAITGHLGPDAPDDLDGIVCMAVANLNDEGLSILLAKKHQLQANDRVDRQYEAAEELLRQATTSLLEE